MSVLVAAAASLSAACKSSPSQGSGGAGGSVAGGGGGGGNDEGGGGGSAGMLAASGGTPAGGGAGMSSNAGNNGQAGSPMAGSGGSGGSAGMGGSTTLALDHFAFASGGGQIQGFKFNLMTGALESIGVTPVPGGSITYLAFHPKGFAIYATSESAQGNVRAFSVAKGTGKLSSLGDASDTGGSGAVHVSVHPTGKWLFVSNYNGGNVRVFGLNESTGAIEAASDTQPTAGESHQILSDPSGNFVFVPCRGDNKIHQYKFNSVTGKLTANGTVNSTDPRHMIFHPQKNLAYLVNENSASVVTYSLNKETGTLTEIKLLPLPEENQASHIEITPDGGFLYAGGRSKPAIHAFKVQGETESLAVVGKHTTSIVFPRDFTMSPSGQHLIVANEPKPGMPSNLVVLKIGPTGELNNVGQPTAAPGSSVIIVPVPRP